MEYCQIVARSKMAGSDIALAGVAPFQGLMLHGKIVMIL